MIHKNKYVADLRSGEVQLLEDGAPRKIAIFEGTPELARGERTIPIEMVLRLDVSLSVMNKNLLDSFSIQRDAA